MSIVHIKREEILGLFDYRQEANAGLATTFSLLAGEEMGLALLEHYLVRQGKSVKRLAGYPKTGQRKGPRLDGWLDIDGKLAQIEVKNWGANAIGGLAHGGKPGVGWQKFVRWFDALKLQKVVHPMKPPTNYDKVDLAVACMWPDVRPQGQTSCFFSVGLDALPPLVFPDTSFQTLHVFSMSVYLHTLTDEFVELSMPKTYARLQKLESLLGIRGKSGFPMQQGAEIKEIQMTK